MNTMKAIAFDTPGSPDVLTLREWPTPQIQHPTELLIQLKAAGVNPIDTKLRQRGTFYPDKMPAVLGLDGAGIVAAIGSQVTYFRVGDEVYFCNGGLGDRPGTYAEFATVDQQFVAPKPATLSFAEAAAVPLVVITAWEALYDRVQLQPGQTVLIHAGAGGVGHVAIQLAKLRGAKVCTTISSVAKAQFVQSLGADLTINYQEQDVTQAVLGWTGGAGVDSAFDTVGGATLSQSIAVVKPYGDVVTILEPAANTDWKTARTKNLRISFELMLTPLLKGLTAAQAHQADILQQTAQFMDNGQFKVHLSKTFPLGAAADAHRFLETGSVTGKVVLVI